MYSDDDGDVSFDNPCHLATLRPKGGKRGLYRNIRKIDKIEKIYNFKLSNPAIMLNNVIVLNLIVKRL